jgi:hypothetical protein
VLPAAWAPGTAGRRTRLAAHHYKRTSPEPEHDNGRDRPGACWSPAASPASPPLSKRHADRRVRRVFGGTQRTVPPSTQRRVGVRRCTQRRSRGVRQDHLAVLGGAHAAAGARSSLPRSPRPRGPVRRILFVGRSPHPDGMETFDFRPVHVPVAQPYSFGPSNTALVERVADEAAHDGTRIHLEGVAVIEIRRRRVVHIRDYIFDPHRWRSCGGRQRQLRRRRPR